eukprot:361311-Chlamydomonas_euryale.AAC.5
MRWPTGGRDFFGGGIRGTGTLQALCDVAAEPIPPKGEEGRERARDGGREERGKGVGCRGGRREERGHGEDTGRARTLGRCGASEDTGKMWGERGHGEDVGRRRQ